MKTKEFNKGITSAFFHSYGIPYPVFEHRFHDTRKWRLDIAWTKSKVAIEVQGGVWTRGKHSRGKGQINDMHKLNAAQCYGWMVFYVTPKELMTKYTAELVKAGIEWQTSRNLPGAGSAR